MVFGRSIPNAATTDLFSIYLKKKNSKLYRNREIKQLFRRKSITIFCGQMCSFYHVVIKQSKIVFAFFSLCFGIAAVSVGTIEVFSSFRLLELMHEFRCIQKHTTKCQNTIFRHCLPNKILFTVESFGHRSAAKKSQKDKKQTKKKSTNK